MESSRTNPCQNSDSTTSVTWNVNKSESRGVPAAPSRVPAAPTSSALDNNKTRLNTSQNLKPQVTSVAGHKLFSVSTAPSVKPQTAAPGLGGKSPKLSVTNKNPSGKLNTPPPGSGGVQLSSSSSVIKPSHPVFSGAKSDASSNIGKASSILKSNGKSPESYTSASNSVTSPDRVKKSSNGEKETLFNGVLRDETKLTASEPASDPEHNASKYPGVPDLKSLNEEDRHCYESQAAIFSGFSSEFAKFLTQTSKEKLTKQCSVKLVNIDANKNSEVALGGMESKASSDDPLSRKQTASSEEPSLKTESTVKRENDQSQSEGPVIKKPKSDDVIVLDGNSSATTSPDIALIKVTKSSSSPKDNIKSDSSRPSGDMKPKMEKQHSSNSSKSYSSDGARKLESGGGGGGGSSQTARPNSSKTDNSDRTSLRDLEARLLHLRQKADQESKAKTMSPSIVKKGTTDSHHRRPDHSNSSGSLERKKSMTSSSNSPVKTAKLKKHLSSPSSSSSRDKVGSVYSPSNNDSKVTILPCKTVPKEGDHKLPSMGSNSVTITKVSSGDSLNISSKDIKKVFSPKSESRLKHSDLDPNSLFKPDKVKVKSSEKSDKIHKDSSKLKDKDHRPKDKDRERGGRVGSLKIIRCSKCREVFSTKEAKKLHTCNSILDAHFLIDGGDRQKTSPVSNSSTSDRSESTSASLSRSSSRSSSPGIPFPSASKKSDSPKSSKVVKKLDEEKFNKVKISINKLKGEDDDDKVKERKFSDKPVIKKDPMREKWIETKRSESSAQSNTLDGGGKIRSDGLVIHHQMTGQSQDMENKERKQRDDGYPTDASLFAFSGKRTYSPSMTETQHVDGKVSPRETNNKDSPASQADSGIFSIASSASPSKIDGGINTDIRSPDSPRINDAQKSDQWKPSTTSTVLSTSSENKSINNFNNGPKGGNGFPSGISLPVNTSITRVASTTSYSINTTTLHKGQVSTSSQGWITSQAIGQSCYLDDKDRKQKNHRGRPRKNGDPIFSGKGKGSKMKGSSDEDKDMYDFAMEEDEDKPVQPLRPRRQNAQPVTYKDPDSDEDAKSRPPQVPLIQATQGYKDIHEKSQSFTAVPPYNSASLALDGSSQVDEEGGEEKDKNVLYKCSRIEETPTGGIKLKIKINKKSASPVPSDNEPPMKKSKIEESDMIKTEPSSIVDKPPLIPLVQPKTEIKMESNISKSVNPVSTSTPSLPSSSTASSSIPVIREVTSMSQGLSGGGMKPKSVPPYTTTVTINNVSSTNHSTNMVNNTNPGSSGSTSTMGTVNNSLAAMPPRTTAIVNSSVSDTQSIMSNSLVKNKPVITSHQANVPMLNNPVGSNNNPPQGVNIGATSSNSGVDELKKMSQMSSQYSMPSKQQQPQLSQPQLSQPQQQPPLQGPPISVNTTMPSQNNFDMQRNFAGGNYMDMTSFSSTYTNYSQQHSMYSNSQYHLAAFRPGIRPGNMMTSRPQGPGNYLPNRMMDPRFQNSMGDSDPMHHPGGLSPHQNPMGMQGMVPSHMGMGMRHPSMMGGLHQNMGNPNMPMNPFPGSPVNSGMNQKGMGMGMGMPNGGQMMNSPVMNPMSSAPGMNPRAMSPHTERPMIGPPSMSPSSVGVNDRGSMFPGGQYRLNSPQYSPHHQPQTNFNQSPNYSGPQGYPPVSMYKPPTPQTINKPPTPQQQPTYNKPPTPQQSPYPQPTTPQQQQNYAQPTTPQHYPKPPTPQNYPQPSTPQNPSTPGGSYPNPSTPGTYHNPTTPLSQQNPLTPQPYEPHTPGGSQHNSSFDSPTNQPVIQPNPNVAASNFAVPKTESSMQPSSNNVYNSKVTTPPMLSPPSTTSSLRNVRIPPKKSATPGTVSPGQKNLSPTGEHNASTIKCEPADVIVPKSEPVPNSPLQSPKSEPMQATVKSEPPEPLPSTEIKTEPTATVKEEEEEPEKSPTPPPPVVAKTPEPPKEPRWGEDGPDGMPERALEIAFSYVCYTEGCLPFLPNAMRVCKLWHKVASKSELWTHANLGSAVKEKSRTEKKLEWILKNKFPHAVQVDLTSWKAVVSTPALRIVAANCPKITGIGLSNCVKLNYEDIRIVPSLFPNLERVDLSLVSPSTASSRSAVSSTALSDLITSMGEKLTHFNMSSNKMAGLPFVFKALSQHSKNLRFLDVSNISTTSRDTILINIEKLQKGCPQLTTFRTTNTMLGLNDVPVREQVMSPGFPMLEELTIGVDQRGYFDGMDDQQIERILKKSNKLRLLDIRGCKGISDSTLVRLPCWDIEYLYVAGCSVTSSSKDGLELLVKKWCRTLIELDIGLTSDQKTVDWAVMALVENDEYLRLRKLNLTGTAVSLKPLTKLLNCCSSLASLNLTSCRALPRGMKRMYHSRDDVEGLVKDIADGKFDARDAGSDDDD